jgi:beta-lactamase regulating signal transducer with metallopeptidase domain
MNSAIENIQPFIYAWLPVLLDSALKGAVLLAMAGLIVMTMRKASAASRQLVWLLTLGATLVLPVASAMLPQWQVLPAWARLDLPTAPAAVVDEAFAPTPMSEIDAIPAFPEKTTLGHEPIEPIGHGQTAVEDAPRQRSTTPVVAESQRLSVTPATPDADHQPTSVPAWPMWLAMIWCVGSLLCLIPVIFGRWSLGRLARRSHNVQDDAWCNLLDDATQTLQLCRRVHLLRSHTETMPMVWGIFRSRLLLPAEADTWSQDRRWVVLLHELAHIKRHDCLAKLIAHVACAVYWFNPLAWPAFRFMQREAETACDDLVLNAINTGTEQDRIRPSDYAQHLLEIASGLRSGLLSSYSSIAMARRNKLEGRLLAILDSTRNRRAVTGVSLLLVGCLVASVAITLSVVMPEKNGDPESGPPVATESGADTMPGEPIDRKEFITKAEKAYRRALADFRNVKIVASWQQVQRDPETGAWKEIPARAKTYSWYERLDEKARMRMDFDPLILKWIDGAAPYSETRLLFTFDGHEFRKLSLVYNRDTGKYGARVAEQYPHNKPKRFVQYAPHNGTHLFHGIASMPEDLQMWSHLWGLWHGVKADRDIQVHRVVRAGRDMIQLSYEFPSMTLRMILDPERGYMPVYSNEAGGFRVTEYRRLTPNLWFPTKWDTKVIAGAPEAVVCEVDEVGFFDPADADAIFKVEDIALGKSMETIPHGPEASQSATGPTVASKSFRSVGTQPSSAEAPAGMVIFDEAKNHEWQWRLERHRPLGFVGLDYARADGRWTRASQDRSNNYTTDDLLPYVIAEPAGNVLRMQAGFRVPDSPNGVFGEWEETIPEGAKVQTEYLKEPATVGTSKFLVLWRAHFVSDGKILRTIGSGFRLAERNETIKARPLSEWSDADIIVPFAGTGAVHHETSR